MENKAARNYIDHLAWFIPAVIGLLGVILDHLDIASLVFSKIWSLFFVNIWYLWLAATAYGLYRFVRLIHNLHNLTNDVLPTLMQDHAENQVKTLELVEKESASRVSADDTLSNRINSLDTRVREDIQRVARELETTLSALVATETEERTGRIAAIGRQMERDIQRLDTMENTLPRQIKELKDRLDRAESTHAPTLLPAPENDVLLPPSGTRYKSLLDIPVPFDKKKPGG